MKNFIFILIISIFIFPTYIAHAGSQLKGTSLGDFPGCDYYLIEDTTGSYTLAEWYGGAITYAGDSMIGDLHSYGFKDIYDITRDRSTHVWLDDWLLSQDSASEKLIDKCGWDRSILTYFDGYTSSYYLPPVTTAPTTNTISCPTNATSINGTCTCNNGYKASGSTCVTYNQGCQIQYGSNSYGDGSYCYCNTGYEFNSTKTQCIVKQVVPTPTPAQTQNTTNSGNLPDGAHPVGTNIKFSDGSVNMITSDGSRRPYTSAGAFLSYGFNTWDKVLNGNAADYIMKIGSFIPPRDGKIVCSDRGTDKGTCYLITGGKKAGFTSAKVFTGLGFSFKNTSSGDMSWMDSTNNIDNTQSAHLPGVLIKINGAYYIMAPTGLLGTPDTATLQSWGYTLAEAIAANVADKALTQAGTLVTRQPGLLSPY